jgi:FhaA, N-terminal domain/FHA domain
MVTAPETALRSPGVEQGPLDIIRSEPPLLPEIATPLGILNEFERRLEGVIEGIFTKAFRGGLQPVELATRILREMEANKTVGVRQVWVPNRYVFTLSEADAERFGQAERSLRRELEQVVKEGAQERGWELVGPPEVEFDVDASLKQGDFQCVALLAEGPTTGHPPAQAAKAAQAAEAAQPERAAELVLIENGKPSRAFPLSKDRVIIGRLGESDIVLSDPGASRRHAEVRREQGGFVISDLGSTNGTMVNESTIGERPLEEGDRITIGRTVLEFRRR